MRDETLLIDHARYVVTLDGARRIVQDGSILVEAGRIRRVGKAEVARKKLLPKLAEPAWFDPQARGPRT